MHKLSSSSQDLVSGNFGTVVMAFGRGGKGDVSGDLDFDFALPAFIGPFTASFFGNVLGLTNSFSGFG